MSLASWVSIPVAAIVAWLIGALWYSPLLFAKAWVRAHGHTPERLAAMQANAGRAYAGSFVGLLLTAQILHLFLRHLRADSIHDGVGWGFHAWLGFALPMGFSAKLFSDKPWATLWIDTGYQLVYLVVMGMILGVWR